MAPKTPKRRLKLLNEVLPWPGPEAIATPRERTLAHLQRLMSAAALVSACSKTPEAEPSPGYMVVDPLPPPADTNTGRKDAGPAAKPPPPPGEGTENTGGAPPGSSTQTTGTGGAKAKPPKHNRGYAVVDPLPSPPPSAKSRRNDPGF